MTPLHQMQDISESMTPLPQIGDVPESTPQSNPMLNAPQLDVNIPDDPFYLPLLDPISRILINNHMYNILEVIFSSQGLVGCGTIYYLMWRGDEEYIIKDHWILESKVDALNEVKMLQMKAELLATIWDIIKIQQIEVEEKGILHYDCSLNNSMIEDDGNGSCGTLIDWEFSVFITQGQKYARGRTLSEAVSSIVTPECSLKCASNSYMVPARLIIHCFEDDLESVFYIFIWICIRYRGSLGVKHVLDKRYNWLVYKWSAITFKACNNEKTTFFYHLYVHKFEEQLHPYFKNLVLSAVECHFPGGP
ncbi:hypothetical protein EDD22DRAFT_851084 [Suillus occidentalis]|nr:hypothetical protein EDD22DRAFT_851084 [Suillus occidentalis]